MSTAVPTVGVDVGGTKVLAGIVEVDGRVTATAVRSTPAPGDGARAVEDAIVEAVLEVSGGKALSGVGLAAAGFVDLDAERVMFAPHLSWRGAPVRSRLEGRLGLPVALENDATCAALAESTYGAARDAASMVMITLGTGIGGGIVVDGRLVRGAHGMAGEFGHMLVVPDGHACECGRRGCWEQYCSGRALERHARSRLDHGPTVLSELCAGDPERLTGAIVTAAADGGDLVARESFRVVGEWLGIGVANLVAALDPEVVVIGGGLSQTGDRLLDPARRALSRTLVGGDHRVVPPLVVAQLGPEAGLVGAAELARRRVAQLRR